ncbi:MAG: hypothetical protein VCC00_06990 [Deltaproteobacteria bacterium]
MTRREIIVAAVLAGILLAVMTPHWLLAGADGIPVKSPLFGHIGTHIAAADSQLLVWILAWDAHALVTQPLSFFDANIFYPAGAMLTGSEALLTSALLAAPLNLLTGNAVLAANFVAWCSYWFALVLTWVLLRDCGRSVVAASLGAATFTFAPFLVPEDLRILQLPHWLLPALILAIRSHARGRSAWWISLVTLLALFGSYYIAAMALLVLAVEFLLACREHAVGRGLVLVGATIPAGLLFVAFSLPYFAHVERVLPPGENGVLPAIVSTGLLLRYIDPTDPEFGATLGMLALALLGAAAPLLRRGTADSTWLRFLLLALAGTLLATGQGIVLFGVTLPMPLGWANEFDFLRVLRATPRFLIVTQLGVAGLAAIGLDLIGHRLAGRGLPRALVGVVTALLAFFAIFAPVRAFDREEFLAQPQREHRAAAYDRLEEEPLGVLLEIPGPLPAHIHMARRWSQGTHMVASTTHWRPIAGGHTGYIPWWWSALSHEIRRTPDPQALAAAIELTGARHILVHRHEIGGRRWLDWLAAGESIPWLRTLYTDDSEILFAVERDRETDWLEHLRADPPGPEATRLGTPLRPLRRENVAASLQLLAAPRKATFLGGGKLMLGIANQGSVTWPALVRADQERPGLVVLEASRRDAAGRLVGEPQRFRLPRDLRPGEATEVWLKLPAHWVSREGTIEWRLRQLGASGFDHIPALVVTTPGS